MASPTGKTIGVEIADNVEGPPELIAKISASTVSMISGRSEAIDLGDKKNAYERNGVQEYWVWRVLDEAIDWFILQDGQYIARTISSLCNLLNSDRVNLANNFHRSPASASIATASESPQTPIARSSRAPHLPPPSDSAETSEPHSNTTPYCAPAE